MRIFLVDAFAHAPFTGNPAGVCPLEGEPEGAWMQGVAMEMNQAETAFLWPEGEGYRLRWFTPTAEVDLCGHATLASAHVLFSEGTFLSDGRRETGGGSGGKDFGYSGPLTPDPSPPEGGGERTVRFLTRSGELVCRQVGDEIEMDFPSEAPTAQMTPGIAEALGAVPVWQGANRMDLFFELESEEAVRGLTPDLVALARLGMRGVIVTAPHPQPLPSNAHEHLIRGEGGADFVSRFFAPRFGIAEDPVTGSAHCALGPYWSAKLGKQTLVGYQASRRGGFVTVTATGPRTTLSGRAKTVLVGSLLP
ncbi:MAG: PhzF family phenazine biosynthesis protein [Fimbriimonadaceae bacterium]